MGIVAHVRHLHLCYFVDADSVVAVVVDRRHDEHRVEHLREAFAASHQFDQPFDIMEYRPRVVPRIPFRICVSPLIGAEGLLERAVGIAAAH